MELTQQYFDQQLGQLHKQLDTLPTHTDLAAQTTELKTFAKEQTEELARIIATTIANPMQQRFDQVDKLVTVEKEVDTLKIDMLKIKQALHLA